MNSDSPTPLETDSPRSANKAILAMILLVALALRYAYVIQIETPPFSDMADYETMALNLLDGEGLVMNTPHLVYQAYRPPLFPLFIAGGYRLFGVDPANIRILQVFLGTLTVLLVYLLTKELLMGTNGKASDPNRDLFAVRTGILAALLMTLEETAIFFCGQLLSETLFTFLLVLLGTLILRGSRNPGLGVATLIGVVGGCLMLTRPIAGPLFLFGVYWFFVRSRKFPAPRPLSWKEFSLFDSPYSPPLIMLIYAGVIVMCWGLRNQAVLGEFVPVSTNGGVNFYLGHHEGFGYDSFGRKEDIRRALRSEGINDEIIESKIFTHAGLDFIRENPGEDLSNTFKKLDYLYLEPADWRSLFQPWKWWSYLDSPYRPWPWETNDSALRFWPVRDDRGNRIVPSYRDWFWNEGRLPLVFWGWPMILFTGFGFIVGIGKFRKLSFPLGMVLIYTLTLLLFFTNARFRAPILPFLYVFAAVGLGRLLWGFPTNTPASPVGETTTTKEASNSEPPSDEATVAPE